MKTWKPEREAGSARRRQSSTLGVIKGGDKHAEQADQVGRFRSCETRKCSTTPFQRGRESGNSKYAVRLLHAASPPFNAFIRSTTGSPSTHQYLPCLVALLACFSSTTSSGRFSTIRCNSEPFRRSLQCRFLLHLVGLVTGKCTRHSLLRIRMRSFHSWVPDNPLQLPLA